MDIFTALPTKKEDHFRDFFRARARQVWRGGEGAMVLGRTARIVNDLIWYSLVAAARKLRTFLRCVLAVDFSTPAPEPLPCKACQHISSTSLVSVVIPAFNEGASIGDAVRSALVNGSHVEVVVADGGSTDSTCAVAAAAGACVVQNCTAGRAGCLNDGARAANGELLVFLHADTLLPPDWALSVRDTLAGPNVAIAAFTLSLHPRMPFLAMVEWGANMRSRYRQLPYGDQALCMRREVYEALGGFPGQPFLEDIDLVCEARRRGAVRLMSPKVVSSSRRWAMHGVLGNTCVRAPTKAARPRAPLRFTVSPTHAHDPTPC
jgi:rSAM/selenodomain-associated transferase 2